MTWLISEATSHSGLLVLKFRYCPTVLPYDATEYTRMNVVIVGVGSKSLLVLVQELVAGVGVIQ